MKVLLNNYTDGGDMHCFQGNSLNIGPAPATKWVRRIYPLPNQRGSQALPTA